VARGACCGCARRRRRIARPTPRSVRRPANRRKRRCSATFRLNAVRPTLVHPPTLGRGARATAPRARWLSGNDIGWTHDRGCTQLLGKRRGRPRFGLGARDRVGRDRQAHPVAQAGSRQPGGRATPLGSRSDLTGAAGSVKAARLSGAEKAGSSPTPKAPIESVRESTNAQAANQYGSAAPAGGLASSAVKCPVASTASIGPIRPVTQILVGFASPGGTRSGAVCASRTGGSPPTMLDNLSYVYYHEKPLLRDTAII
jgi:hypothetical protein